ncbi:MAG: efflux RND transporter periplasmic adaptor subunit, partial [Planctomycetota bacterium]
DGVVREVEAASGTWVSADVEVVHVVAPQALRFRGRALQADLIDHLRDGQLATVVPPTGDRRQQHGPTGRVRIGFTGSASARTVDLFIDLDHNETWMRPLVAALAEIVTAGGTPQVAIPQRAVVADGLNHVVFRRHGDHVERLNVTLGVSDGRWVVVDEMKEGDEVVVDGAYQLLLATTTNAASSKAGHFHADGTFHQGEH